MLAHLVDRNDVGMVELRDRLGLVLEPHQLRGRGELGRPDQLEGHQPVQRELTRLVDDAHPAPAQLVEDLVTGDDPGLGHGRGGLVGRRFPRGAVGLGRGESVIVSPQVEAPYVGGRASGVPSYGRSVGPPHEGGVTDVTRPGEPLRFNSSPSRIYLA